MKKTVIRPRSSKPRPSNNDGLRSPSREKVRVRPSHSVQPATKTKPSQVLDAFEKLWEALFTTPIHLDSALSKQPPNLKSILAQIVPVILLKPVSLAEALGVGVPLGEPWSLSPKMLAKWRPARLMAERLYESMSMRWPEPETSWEDFPTTITDELKRYWTENIQIEILEVLGSAAPLSLRASQKLGPKKLLEELNSTAKLPVKTEISSISPYGLRLSGYVPVLGSKAYETGGFEIQDEGSQLMALFALWPEKYAAILQSTPGKPNKPGFLKSAHALPEENLSKARIVDACAGAGGKSLAMSDALKGKGRVFAYDIAAKKLQSLRKRAVRLGLNNIQTVLLEEGNEEKSLEKFHSSAEVVLVDAPCSGWGVLRRNPDIKWRQKSEALDRMPEIQLRLLDQYSKLVAPKGRLVFGVCTFRKEETVDVVDQFLKTHPEFKAQLGGYLGPGPCDGFFMQSFTRE